MGWIVCSIDPVTRHPVPLQPYVDEVKAFLEVSLSFNSALYISHPFVPGKSPEGASPRAFAHRCSLGSRRRLSMESSPKFRTQNGRRCKQNFQTPCDNLSHISSTSATQIHGIRPTHTHGITNNERSDAQWTHRFQFSQHPCVAAHFCPTDLDAGWGLALR